MTEADDLLKFGEKSELQTLDEKSKKYQKKSRSESTKESYTRDWQYFVDWCLGLGLQNLPAEPSTVRRYITFLADLGKASSTISRAMTSISQAHKILSLQSPTTAPDVLEVWKGIRREHGTAKKRAKPLMYDDLKIVIDNIRPTFIGRRDAALLMIGWAGALRRSEIVAINREDIEFVPEGMILNIPKSKTDQNSEGFRLGIPFGTDEKYCPTKRLQSWIRIAGIESGPIFFQIGMSGKKFVCDISEPVRLTSRMVNVIIQRRMRRAGFDTRGYSGHSLRAGFVTTAAKMNIPEYLIQIHTRHRTTKCLREYIRDSQMFTENSLTTIL